MATYTLTTGTIGSPYDCASAGSRGSDTWNLNGCYALWDIDSRYGLNGTTAAQFATITGSASLGGTLEVNSTKVRLIPFDTGSGTVPANDTVISIGSASGKLIGVYSALNAAPTAVAAAMPASGYIKIRQWNSVSYTTGALTGISANATAVDGPGWIELVGLDAGLCTINRLNTLKMRGDWYYFQGVVTTGTRTTSYQIPNNGSAVCYFPGVEVETGVGTGVYEFYPCAGSKTALIANIQTDSVRGKWCWITTAGLLYFGYDATNQTGAYCPPAGRKLRIPNIFLVCAVSAATVNVLPSATMTTRYEFAVGGGGVVDMDKVSCNWFCNFNQGFDIKLTNFFVFEQVILTECASPIAWDNVGIGMTAANTQQALTMSLNFAGGTMNNCTWTRALLGSSGHYVCSWADCSGFTITNEKVFSLTKSTNATSGSHTLTRVSSSTWTNTKLVGGGRVLETTCTDVKFLNTTYVDNINGSTGTAIPMFIFDIASNCSNCTYDGIDWGGLSLVQPYSGILQIGAAGCANIKLRNLGTAAAPLDMGGPQLNATWTRSAAVATVTTAVSHNLKTGDVIYCLISSDTAAITVAAKTLTAAGTTTTFTFACTNGGGTSGTLTYYPTMAASLVVLAAGAAANNVRIQKCYTPHTRSVLVTGDNSSKNILFESVWGSEWAALLAPELNATFKNVVCTPALTAQGACYGTHWFDYFTTNGLICTGKGYTQATTTATITSVDHGLRTGDFINVTYSSNTAIIILGQKTITAVTRDTFTFACLTGSTTGTINYTPLNSRVAIQMNEPTTDTSGQVTLTNGSAFTSAGTLYMPVIGHQADFTCPHKIIGHSAFPIAEAVMAGGTIANHDIEYSLDNGVSYHNLYYARPGGSGTSGQYTFTVTNATGVEIGDYVWGTNIGYNAKVTDVVTNTITVDIANIGTVSGIIRFNHLPSEIISDPLVGFNLQLRIVTAITNTAAISSLYFYTYSTPTNRQATYPLDTLTISITARDAADSSVIPGARVYLVAAAGGSLPVDTVIINDITNASGVAQNTAFEYSGQPVVGRVRKGSSSPLYKTSPIVGTVTSNGLSLDVFLVKDE